MTSSLSTGYPEKKRISPEGDSTSSSSSSSSSPVLKKQFPGRENDHRLTQVFTSVTSFFEKGSTDKTFEGFIIPPIDSEKIIAIKRNSLLPSEHSLSSPHPSQNLSRAASSEPIDRAALRKAALEKAIETLKSDIVSVSFEVVESISQDCFTKDNGFFSSISKQEGFRQFNRWHIARPWDHNLCGGVTEAGENDYVNASRLTFGDQTLFASDAPKPRGFERFWNFVWREDIQVIVNLTELYEKGEKVADSYWIERSDAEKTRGFGNRFNPNAMIRLTFESENFILTTIGASEIDIGDFDKQSYDEKKIQYITKRTYTLEKGSVAKTVIHYHYRHWPDHGAPASPEERATFLALVDHAAGSSRNGPVLVHCSAGLGRTGTFLAAYHLRKKKFAGMTFDRPEFAAGEIVLQMRAQRNGLIRSSAQFNLVAELMGKMQQNPSV
jgi:protein tyrosine phosphatase